MLHQGSRAAPASWCTYWTARRCARAASGGRPLTSAAVEADLAAGLALDAEQRTPERGLAAARLADEPQRLARTQGERHAGHRLHRWYGRTEQPPLPAAQQHDDVARLENGRAGAHAVDLFPLVGEPAADEVARRIGDEPGQAPAADLGGMPTAGREAAAGRGAERRRHQAWDARERVRAVGMAGQQRPRVGMARIGQHLGRGPGLHGLPGVHHGDGIAELGDDAEVVRHEQHGDAEFLGERFQELQDLQLRRDIERRGRLVGDDEGRAAGQRAGDHQPLALAAGELVRIALEHGFGLRDLHAAQQRHEMGAAVPLGAQLRGAVPAQHRQQLGADLEYGVQGQVGVLRDEADAAAAHAPRHLAVAQGQQVLALEQDLAAVDGGGLGDDAEDRARQGGLAATGFADHAQNMPARQASARRGRGSAPAPRRS